MSRKAWAHAETIAQNIVGTVLAQIVCFCFAVPFGKAVALNIVMFAVSYARTYAIRRLFEKVQKT